MACEEIRTSVGNFVVCNRGWRRPKCSVSGCAARADYQCDYPVGEKKTCDRNLCRDHAIKQIDVAPFPWHVEVAEISTPAGHARSVKIEGELGQSVDYCPEHDAAAHREVEAPPAQRELFPRTLTVVPGGRR